MSLLLEHPIITNARTVVSLRGVSRRSALLLYNEIAALPSVARKDNVTKLYASAIDATRTNYSHSVGILPLPILTVRTWPSIGISPHPELTGDHLKSFAFASLSVIMDT